uniref:Aminoglycoside phosphotransferase domain-containing protein n=1 Tax=Alexandrium monilatum TaxID=311494 RepID=A0A7S4SL22_9DINO
MAAASAAASGPLLTLGGEFAGPTGDILEGLDGAPLGLDGLTSALRSAGEIAEDRAVVGVEVVPGSELRWTQSHSAKLRLALGPSANGCSPDRQVHSTVYLKKVLAKGMPPKSLSALRRDLASNRNEARFYREFAPILAGRGLPLLRALLVDERIAVGESSEPAPDGAPSEEAAAREEAALRSGGLLLLMESADGYWQTSPLDTSQAAESLHLLARFHASAWQDAELLSAVAGRLHRTGGYWTLEQRGEEELRRMGEHWRQYVAGFSSLAPELFRRPGVAELAARVERLAPWVARQLAPSPGDPFATLIHGDYKAMNIFLREGQQGRDEAQCSEPGCKRPRVAGQGAPARPCRSTSSGRAWASA